MKTYALEMGSWFIAILGFLLSVHVSVLSQKVAVVTLLRPNQSPTFWMEQVSRFFPTATPIIFVEEESTLVPNGIVLNFSPCVYDASKYCKATALSEKFKDGYKNMCQFWFSDAWEHLRGYDVAVRVDEDVTLFKVGRLDNIRHVSSPLWQSKDNPDVTMGLKQFFNTSLNPLMPYSNVFLINITWANTFAPLLELFVSVRSTNCICINRWGDLPLWGHVLNALNIEPHVSRGWIYYHGSHNSLVAQEKRRRFTDVTRAMNALNKLLGVGA